MKKIAFLLFFFILSACGNKSVEPWGINEPVLLPDGQAFPFWDDQTVYKKVYYVDQNHPVASDNNSGTEESPFLTISQAARVLMPGEKVIVKEGIYRESVRPTRGGENEESMIYYEAAPGYNVVISGSEVVKEKWGRSRTPYQPSMTFSQKLWMVSIPYTYFTEPNPFLIQNADEYEMSIMPWAKNWTNRVPYTLGRGVIFQDGIRMTQLSSYEDIVKLPGSYWVDTVRNDKFDVTIHIHPFLVDDPYTQVFRKDPNTIEFEITTRQSIFNPKIKGINYIRVKGFTFEQVGNGFQRTGNGAFSTFGGSHWIIEDNVFRKINSVAVEIGALTNEHIENVYDIEEFEAVSGRHIVRNNVIYDCGTGGIQGLINMENFVENNHLYDIGWQEAEFYWETAAMKLLLAHNCLLRRNHMHDIEAAMGIWLDSWNINSRVTQNLIYNVNCNQGSIFMEASSRPNLVDNNFVWNCGRNGIYQHDCDSLYIVHNIIGHSKENGIKMNLTRKNSTARHNKILNNILIDNPSPFSYSDTINISDYNIITLAGSKSSFDWNAWNSKGFDKNSKLVEMSGSFDTSDLVFKLKINVPLPQVDRLPFITEDFLGRKYDSQSIAPGALKNGTDEIIQLSRYFKHHENY